MGHYTVQVAIQCTHINYIKLQMLFSLGNLKQGLPGGSHLLNQWQRKKTPVLVYPTSHQCEVMDRHPSLSTYSMHDNRQSFSSLQYSS